MGRRICFKTGEGFENFDKILANQTYLESTMRTTSSKRQSQTRSNKKSQSLQYSLKEAKLRRIVKREMRNHLIREGLMDAIRKLKDSAKQKASGFLEKNIPKMQKYLDKYSPEGMEYPEDLKKFTSAFEEESGMSSIKDVLKTAEGVPPELKSLVDIKSILKKEDLASLSPGSSETKKESINFDELGLNFLLEEERALQINERLTRDVKRLNEVLVVGTVAAIVKVWWTSLKVVVSGLGFLHFVIKAIGTLIGALGFTEVAEKFEHAAHAVHKAEDFMIAKMVFPPKVQYAAYVALEKTKGALGKGDGKVLSFKEFDSDEKLKKSVFEGLKIALLSAIIFEAFVHLWHVGHEFLQHGAQAFKKALLPAGEAGIEGRAASNLVGGAKAAKAARDATIAATLAKDASSSSTKIASSV